MGLAGTQVTVSCIIPAFNEAARIGGVLSIALGHPALAEVIVVDDGSQDGTADIAAQAGARVIRMTANGGKAAAVFRAAEEARGTHVLMLDADLLGLAADDISRLVAPVMRGECDVTISLRGNSPAIWRAMGVDYISGERVMPVEDLRRPAPIAGFGLEVWLNRGWRLARRKVRIVSCPNLSSPAKAAKKGLLPGLLADVGMLRDIFRTASLPEVLRQLAFFMRASRD
ncbi:glycosyltransferase family 2 protein [Falsirhodobacter xinxiangensis]|uniref:glycosyltransferase family 2 protein n=1 Tax=Falsirhodobacter xinxiangensis TaxID=2530049 RepID=UPI0010A9B95C|nr:glycosyltransferase family 2 protein [Rhodobacter xinxiangensis]